jgi:hypothetical protein
VTCSGTFGDECLKGIGFAVLSAARGEGAACASISAPKPGLRGVLQLGSRAVSGSSRVGFPY